MHFNQQSTTFYPFMYHFLHRHHTVSISHLSSRSVGSFQLVPSSIPVQQFQLLTLYSFGISAPFQIPLINPLHVSASSISSAFMYSEKYSTFICGFILYIANFSPMSKILKKTRPSITMTLFISGIFSYSLTSIRLPIDQVVYTLIKPETNAKQTQRQSILKHK